MDIQKLTAFPEDAELNAQGAQLLEQLQSAVKSLALTGPDPGWQAVLQRIFCCSPFIARIFIGKTELLADFLRQEALYEVFSIDRFQAYKTALENAADEGMFMQQLRRLRLREIIRIAIRDLLGWADLQETLTALSELAEFCVSKAHAYAYHELQSKHGIPLNHNAEPQSLVVIAMGKLGGRELNYSSDVDLIFTYPEKGKTRVEHGSQREIDNQAFFTQQAQRIVKYLQETTEDGFVFRVDARLRPFGDSGALVVSFDFMETYYQNQGRDWERYAMIKARPICGQPSQANELMAMLRPFVYRRYLDYSAFAALRDMKAMIVREVNRKKLGDDVKLGAGGIREVEFIAQAFQLIRAGREPGLRRRELIPVLQFLAEHYLLEQGTVDCLIEAYRFLRNVENRLQMVADRQTHRLPQQDLERARLAYAMGFSDWQVFADALTQHRDAVRKCFTDVFFTHDQQQSPDAAALQLLSLIEGRLHTDEATVMLTGLGFQQVSEAFEVIDRFRKSHAVKHISQMSRERLANVIESLFQEVAATRQPEQTLARVLHVLQAVVQRSVYLVLLAEHPDALRQLVNLCAASGWVTEYLFHQPVLLDGLLDPRQLYSLPSRQEMAIQLQQLIKSMQAEDFEQQLNALRHFKQEQTLRVAAVDVSNQLPLMKVSDQLTWLAEVILNEVHNQVYLEICEKYGILQCQQNNQSYEPELAIIAYGKLGGIELGYSSDLDIVFLHNSAGHQQPSDGARQVGHDQYFMRYAQRLMHILGTQTLGGVLYEVDVRLRPDGASGPLVSSVSAFTQYQHKRAWTWEHQALVRARMIAGGDNIRTVFEALRHKTLCAPRDITDLRIKVREMRDRMRNELIKKTQEGFDIKQGRGGLADIEFMVQFGVLAWAQTHPVLTRYTDNVRILEQFGELGLFSENDVEKLIDAYKHLRTRLHRLALQGDPAVLPDLSVSEKHIEEVAGIWHRFMDKD